MALAEDIGSLESRALSALNGSHDYFTYTKRVWRLLQRSVKEGQTFAFRNLTTGTKVNERDLLGQAQLYLTNYLVTSSFQHFISLFEVFFFDLLRIWLVTYPQSLSQKQVDFGTVLDATDKTTIVLTVVERNLNDLKYKRVSEWFKYLEDLMNIDLPLEDEIEKLAEIKASRDVLAHNNGVANSIYVDKSGKRARHKDGEKLEIPEKYHRESWEVIKKVVEEVSSAVIAKAGKSKSE